MSDTLLRSLSISTVSAADPSSKKAASCHQARQLGKVPRRLCKTTNQGSVSADTWQGVVAFTGTPATRNMQCKPFDPESKGIVERVNRYSEIAFLIGRRSVHQRVSLSSPGIH
ncbi:hypothetical protein [Nocardia sp. NPDC005745]|uniref:hypothetical protein n=1 Tax=Nocardia sp. NPDC005745 TaxID=3157061 RepID=UPI0034087428